MKASELYEQMEKQAAGSLDYLPGGLLAAGAMTIPAYAAGSRYRNERSIAGTGENVLVAGGIGAGVGAGAGAIIGLVKHLLEDKKKGGSLLKELAIHMGAGGVLGGLSGATGQVMGHSPRSTSFDDF